MPAAITPDRYDADTAAAMTAGSIDGLPSYLGIRTVEVGPATMLAELDVRPELLNPFGTLHGGVVSALVDHVLGAVLYPVIKRGHWAVRIALGSSKPTRFSENPANTEVRFKVGHERTPFAGSGILSQFTFSCRVSGD